MTSNGVPDEIHRRVLVEAAHRCATPTCRYIQIQTELYTNPIWPQWDNVVFYGYEDDRYAMHLQNPLMDLKP